MTHLQTLTVRKWVSLNLSKDHFVLFITPPWRTGSTRITQNPRFYRRPRVNVAEYPDCLDQNWGTDGKKNCRISRATWAEAQAALLDYLHSTRSLHFTDAEIMSKNSPHFLYTLLKRIKPDSNMARFLRYHPINEFELFFESIGLKPSEYTPLLPRGLLYLSDDEMLLENFRVLRNYGIPCNRIGKIYKKAIEVFQFDYGVLFSKLEAYEKMGLKKTYVLKAVASTPSLLIGSVDKSFVIVLNKLESMGMEHDWIETQLVEDESYNWNQMLELLSLFSSIGFNEVQLGRLLIKHPDFVFEDGGGRTFLLIGFLMKFGFTSNELYLMFLKFPELQIQKFVHNLKNVFRFLKDIKMEAKDVQSMIRAHSLFLGSCTLRKTKTILTYLNTGKKRLCGVVKENPEELRKWVVGSKVEPLLESGEDQIRRDLKTKFLLDIGFVKDSDEIRRVAKVFKGQGDELWERFNCFVEAGLDEGDVSKMVKTAPQILNLSKEMIEKKIDSLVNGHGYPVSLLLAFPAYVCYNIKRVKLRLSVYNWLKDQGAVEPGLALITLIASSENAFQKTYVRCHARGPQVWQEMKKKIYSE